MLRAPSDTTLTPCIKEGCMCLANMGSGCLLSHFFCPSSKLAQQGYAKGPSEGARSASVYGTRFSSRFSQLNPDILKQIVIERYRNSDHVCLSLERRPLCGTHESALKNPPRWIRPNYLYSDAQGAKCVLLKDRQDTPMP